MATNPDLTIQDVFDKFESLSSDVSSLREELATAMEAMASLRSSVNDLRDDLARGEGARLRAELGDAQEAISKLLRAQDQ
jgi:hypothetical protein